MPDIPLLCIKNCGCRHPERAHCQTCHQTNEKFKIKQREEKCCSENELDYLFVIDFECTCDEYKRLKIQEIIEFPIIVIDLKQMAIVDKFHSFVKPTIYPTLTPFCTQLTGITQEKVDSALELPEVLKQVDKFLEKYISKGISRVSVLNDCDSDIRNFLRKESTYKGIAVKPVFKEFIDLRRIFPVKIAEKPTNIDYMLQVLGLEFEGIKHCGLDDATNIARVALEIAKKDYIYTDRLKENMYPYENPHYYEHLILIAAQPKLKNNVEIAMIAHDLRKNKTLWNNIGMKSVKKQEMKQELFNFLDKVGIDVDNSILCVQGKLENEVKAFFQQPDSANGDESSSKIQKQAVCTLSTATTCLISKKQSVDLNLSSCSTSSTSSNESNKTPPQQVVLPPSSSSLQNYFTTYFSLNKISKIAGVPVLSSAQQEIMQNYSTYSQKYQQSRHIYQPYPLSQSDPIFFQQPMNRTTEQMIMGSLNYQQVNQEQKWWSSSSSQVASKLTSMCGTVEKALQNGFIFTKEFASTISLKRAFSQM